jgi:hypothetical protein
MSRADLYTPGSPQTGSLAARRVADALWFAGPPLLLRTTLTRPFFLLSRMSPSGGPSSARWKNCCGRRVAPAKGRAVAGAGAPCRQQPSDHRQHLDAEGTHRDLGGNPPASARRASTRYGASGRAKTGASRIRGKCTASSATQFRSRFSSAKSDSYKVHALVRILVAQPQTSGSMVSRSPTSGNKPRHAGLYYDIEPDPRRDSRRPWRHRRRSRRRWYPRHLRYTPGVEAHVARVVGQRRA